MTKTRPTIVAAEEDRRRRFVSDTVQMKRSRRIPGAPARFIACCLTISFTAMAAFAEERHDYVFDSEVAFAAFQCSVFAAHAKYDLEEKRLFAHGLEQARLFIQAARAGRVSAEDFARTNFVWPLALRAWNFQPQDTSTDFVAGQVYEMIWTNLTEELGRQSPDQKSYQEPARAEFSSHNCSLLAK
jgi:hypothetical protein